MVIQNNNKKKTFAFQLASQQKTEKQWQVRSGVAVAGCSDPTGNGDYRYMKLSRSDNGAWC
jgi:hypothetical protein